MILQDLTGVPLVVDLAGLRDAVQRLGGDAGKVNPECPVDLVIDHSVQVDFARSLEALQKNEEKEFERNRERFEFLKWGQSTFENFRIVPPGYSIVFILDLELSIKSIYNILLELFSIKRVSYILIVWLELILILQ